VTPVGLFIYRQIPARAYEAGMVRVEAENGQAFLIASPEKALADKIVSVRGAGSTAPIVPRIARIRGFRLVCGLVYTEGAGGQGAESSARR
jgi:hypothetical protein